MAILAQDGELASNLAELGALGWDSDVDLATLTREHALRLIDAFSGTPGQCSGMSAMG
jgi:hypothetical protein